MQIFHRFTQQQSPCVLTIGNFDGVHRGHVALLSRLREIAKQYHLPAGVLTFTPHPRHFFAINSQTLDTAPATITPLREKVKAIADCGIDRLFIVHFTKNIAELSADQFIEQILINKLNIKYLLIGENFRFGKNRAGTTDLLRKAGVILGFQVEVLPAIVHNKIRISSSSVRSLLLENNFKQASILLGRSFSISGHIVHGERLGHQLGFPTANILIRHINPILSGVYITQIHGLAEQPLPAVSMIGTKPTISDNGRIVLETHILNFDRNCYGCFVKVEFLKKLRDNKKFPDLNALKAAINNDVNTASQFFQQLTTKKYLTDRPF